MTKMMAKKEEKLCEAFHSVGPFLLLLLFVPFFRSFEELVLQVWQKCAAFSSLCAVVACFFFLVIFFLFKSVVFFRERKN
jgi:hypothetical protein